MGGAMLGVVAAVFAVLMARRLGLDWRPAKKLLWYAVALFAISYLTSGIGLAEPRDQGSWMSASQIATGVGALFLFGAITSFRRLTDGEPPTEA